jgi:ABC-2 type transport system ATP-binding protein
MRIQAAGLTKEFGGRRAVDGLSFTVEPGRVTGFAGPNGAGKSTTLQLMLGLVHGGGRTLFDGRPYRDLPCPVREVGAVLDARSFHPRRSARDHLWMLAAAGRAPAGGRGRAPDRRVDQLLDLVGLAPVAGRPAGGFSLGMAQRLGLAAALLGDPRALLLDEPANGLDPHGLAWLRELLRAFAAGGGAVLVSSHLLAEMQLLADHVVVIGRGRLLADEPLDQLVGRSVREQVLVRSPDAGRLAELLAPTGAAVDRTGDGELTISGVGAEVVGDLAHEWRLRLHQLTTRSASLEAAFLGLTRDDVEYVAGDRP